MEWLLLEIAVEVAKNLTPRDLSACCAVSPHWREVFGSDQVWKPLCDPELDEHLCSTTSVVEPAFSVPQEQDSTLTPVCRWRKAFLREQHLWGNWRNGNFKTVEYEVENMKTSLERFITNDLIVSFYYDSVELWDVRVIPPVRVDRFVLGKKFYYNPIVFENAIVVLQSYSHDLIQVLKIDVTEGTISMKYQFLFNQITKLPELVCDSSWSLGGEPNSLNSFNIQISAGMKCVGCFWFREDNYLFHVWDLKSGIKLKDEPCPQNSLGCGLGILGSKTCDDVLVLVCESVFSQLTFGAKIQVECHVYNVQHLHFLSFKQKFWVLRGHLINSFEICAIINNFVALTDCDDADIKAIRLFNYQTGHQLHMLDAISPPQVIDDSCFLFVYNTPSSTEEEDRLYCVVCPSGEIVEDVIGDDVEHFEVVGNKFVQVVPFGKFSEIWKISKKSTFKTGVFFPEFKEVNRFCTKLITERTVEEVDMIRISHFW